MEQKETQKLIVERNVLVGVLQYLQTRPWAEVNGLIAGLLTAEGIEGAQTQDEPKTIEADTKDK